MNASPFIFDRNRVRAHRSRAARRFFDYDFMVHRAGEILSDRLYDMSSSFERCLSIGNDRGVLDGAVKDKKIGSLIRADMCEAMLTPSNGTRLVLDEEILPFAANRFDAVVCIWNLHWVNDLVGTLIQIRQILKDDGLFLAIVPGAYSLQELRDAITQAAGASGTIRPMVSPFVDVRDAGNLLQRAGFALPVVDSEMVTVSYDHAFKLMEDLRGMGESNALSKQHRGFMPKGQMMAIVEAYHRQFMDSEGRIPASFELVSLTGWKPHDSQQQPLARGSGEVNMNDFFKKN